MSDEDFFDTPEFIQDIEGNLHVGDFIELQVILSGETAFVELLTKEGMETSDGAVLPLRIEMTNTGQVKSLCWDGKRTTQASAFIPDLTSGKRLLMQIFAQPTEFEITINGRQVGKLIYACPVDDVSAISIYGDAEFLSVEFKDTDEYDLSTATYERLSPTDLVPRPGEFKRSDSRRSSSRRNQQIPAVRRSSRRRHRGAESPTQEHRPRSPPTEHHRPEHHRPTNSGNIKIRGKSKGRSIPPPIVYSQVYAVDPSFNGQQPRSSGSRPMIFRKSVDLDKYGHSEQMALSGHPGTYIPLDQNFRQQRRRSDDKSSDEEKKVKKHLHVGMAPIRITSDPVPIDVVVDHEGDRGRDKKKNGFSIKKLFQRKKKDDYQENEYDEPPSDPEVNVAHFVDRRSSAHSPERRETARRSQQQIEQPQLVPAVQASIPRVEITPTYARSPSPPAARVVPPPTHDTDSQTNDATIFIAKEDQPEHKQRVRIQASPKDLASRRSPSPPSKAADIAAQLHTTSNSELHASHNNNTDHKIIQVRDTNLVHAEPERNASKNRLLEVVDESDPSRGGAFGPGPKTGTRERLDTNDTSLTSQAVVQLSDHIDQTYGNNNRSPDESRSSVVTSHSRDPIINGIQQNGMEIDRFVHRQPLTDPNQGSPPSFVKVQHSTSIYTADIDPYGQQRQVTRRNADDDDNSSVNSDHQHYVDVGRSSYAAERNKSLRHYPLRPSKVIGGQREKQQQQQQHQKRYRRTKSPPTSSISSLDEDDYRLLSSVTTTTTHAYGPRPGSVTRAN